MQNYRKIWESKYGKIPYDTTGRKMEIHHRDGNRENNTIENLQLLTINEHYHIHYTQGDWGACQSIINRMRVTPEEKSRICSELANKRVSEGTHHFQNPEFIKKDSERKSRDRFGKNHPLYNKPVSAETRIKRSKSHNVLVEQGNHHLQSDSHKERMSAKAKLEIHNGTHPFQQIEYRNRLKDRIGEQIKNKTHSFNRPNRVDPNKIIVFCTHCQKEVTKPVFGRFHKH